MKVQRAARVAAVAGILIAAVVSSAQTPQTIYQSGRRYPDGGKLAISPHPSEPVGSFDQLLRMSHLIVDGTVSAVLPSIHRNPDIPWSIETHSLVSIREVLFGTLPTGTQSLVLVQEGGKAGRWEIVVPDDPLVEFGERYILFLAPDTRKEPANTFGVPRFWSVGYWSGKAKVDEKGKIQFLPLAAPELHGCANKDASAFIAIVRDRLNLLFPKPMPYPRGARVLKPPSKSIFPTSPRPFPPSPCS